MGAETRNLAIKMTFLEVELSFWTKGNDDTEVCLAAFESRSDRVYNDPAGIIICTEFFHNISYDNIYH